VHESETTELASSLEPADWRVPSGNYLEDLSQTRNKIEYSATVLIIYFVK
jgi:hypothetical protein